MNKIAKGAIAGGVGVALLLGGAGTLAYWTDSIAVGSNATITAGNLTVAATSPTPADDGWTVTNGSLVVPAVISDIASFRAVPGDVLKFKKTLSVTATGNNIRAQVATGTGAITAATPVTAANTALASRLTASTSYTVNGSAGSGVTLNAGTHPVVVEVTITWPFGGPVAPGATSPALDNPAKLGAVTLNNFNVVVNQVQP